MLKVNVGSKPNYSCFLKYFCCQLRPIELRALLESLVSLFDGARPWSKALPPARLKFVEIRPVMQYIFTKFYSFILF